MASHSPSSADSLPQLAGGAGSGHSRSGPAGSGPATPRRLGTRRLAAGSWLFVLPAVVYLVLFYGYPLVENISMSLREYTAATFFTGHAPFVGLANYSAVLQSADFRRALWHTAVFTIGSIALQYTLGLALALFFRKRFPGSSVFRALLLIPWLIPAVVTGTVFRWVLDQDFGVLNSILRGIGLIDVNIGWLSDPSWALLSVTLVNVWMGIPFTMVLLHSGLQAIPGELYEAASLDGAGRPRQFWYITLPQLRPVTAVVLLLSLIYTVRAFDLIQVLTGGGPANSSQVLSTLAYLESFTRLDFGRGATVSNILVLISVVFALFYLRSTREERSDGR